MADAVLATGFVLHTLALIVSVLWAAWSIQRHGWRKRSTRRLSYYMYVALHAVRLFWLAALARAGADATLDELELRSPTAAVLNRVALCLAFNAFSMLVFGWANVTSSGAGACARALPARRVFLLLNGAHWASHAGLCAALLAAAARGPSDRLRLLVRLDAALVVAFAAALAALAAAFGLMLSARFVQLAAAAADPTLGGYVTVKFNKVNVAWHVFCACFALRAVFLAAALPGVGPIVGRAHLYAFGYFTPGEARGRSRAGAECPAEPARWGICHSGWAPVRLLRLGL